MRTESPERSFAPLIEIPADEPWRPMSARWFIERSSFGLSGCGGGEIAVGRQLPERHDAATDWIFVEGVGVSDHNYYRNYYDDRTCEVETDRHLYADQLTRPYDPGPRPEGLSEEQGFYLDLADGARGGPPLGPSANVPTYVERTDEGDSGVRLTYWTLYGMNGIPGRPGAHEGDWERVDVLLHADGDRYEPVTIQVSRAPFGTNGSTAIPAERRDISWDSVPQSDGTHPVLRAARGSHELSPPGGACDDCRRWSTWERLDRASDQPWYGFGGAWGEVGPTSATTGPLGPHRFWPTAADASSG